MKRDTSSALRGRNIGPPAEHGGERGSRFGVVVLVRPGQRDDQAARDVMRQPVHVVDFRREQQLADIGEHRVRHDRAGRVFHAIDRRGDAAGEKAFGNRDEFDHGVADVAVAFGVEPVRLDHQRAGADQQIAEAGARADAGMAVVGGVGRGEEAAFLVFAGQKHALVRHEHVVEDDDAGRLAVFAGEFRRRLAGASRRPGDDGHARRIDRHGAADGKIRVLRVMRPARHDEEFVHVGRAGDDGLGAADDDAVRPALRDVDIDVGVRLRARALRAVALGVGHGDAERQVLVLDAVQIGEKALGDSRCRARRRCASSPGRVPLRASCVR